MTNSKNDPKKALKASIFGYRFLGYLTIILCFGGFGAWASTAQLSSAAIATGQISPDGSQRTVQHLEGGIVSSLSAKEGEVVSKNQPLLVLDTALAEANFQSKFKKFHRLKIIQERLLAQQHDQDKFISEIPAVLKDNKNFKQFVENEHALFLLKRKLVQEQNDIYSQQEEQVKTEIVSLNKQSDGLVKQLGFLKLELAAKIILKDKGLIRVPELLAVQRKYAELSSSNDAFGSSIARAEQKITEIRISQISVKTGSLEKVAEELSKINAELVQVGEALSATGDVLSRTVIYSPIDGKILKLNHKTIGGVVRPGEPILIIVPTNEDLIVEARLLPTDIDNVSLGMQAEIQLSSFMARHMVPLKGIIYQIGADVETDPDTREKYYTLRVRVDEESKIQASEKINLQPGMPADVFVQTGLHTPFQYMVGPIMKSFKRAFREEVVN
ncbi:MAG: HlyD family type I secretion periplasmic adaptor subunit [Rhizobiaceae bacterium]|nr:HlyD family type I secretion periplasmic adaptor subunit [Rhizobiaceae bacterium]